MQFEIGMKINHPKYGDGVIRKLDSKDKEFAVLCGLVRAFCKKWKEILGNAKERKEVQPNINNMERIEEQETRQRILIK